MTARTSPVLAGRTLPPRAGAATRVLTLVDDPDAGVAQLAQAIGADPAFASRVLALANSTYYGLSGRVGTLHYAISVVGFQTIRALAVSIAAGIDDPSGIPDGFWEQAALAATAAGIVAPLIGANAPDAFCVGLLHTLGAALLHQQHPLPQLCLPAPVDGNALEQRELALYGIGHAAAGAEVLSAWHFPERLCALVATHHEVPLPDADPLTRTLHAARTLADVALSEHADQARAESTLQRLTEGRLSPGQLPPLLERVTEQSAALLDGLRVR